MNPVIAVLRKHIADNNVRFVFPSQTSAGLWAQKTCTMGIVRSVAAKRFLAWDRFKEEAILERETEREPVTSVMRKLFAEAMARKNAETPFFASLIPPKHSRIGKVFVPFIARLLPSLAYWEKLVSGAKGGSPDSEDRDYVLLKIEYRDFLERHNLFEPSWEEIRIREGNRYVIFFPELVEDFAEYDALLLEPQFIRVTADTVSGAGKPCLVYQSAREEIRAAVMEIQRLHGEEGFPYEDMAVSVPALEEMEPWLLKEFSLRHIPVTRRAGKKLGESGAGRFFSLVNECAASGFSFNSLKALILNDHIPWREKEKNKALINFGIKYNCVSGYVEDGKPVDIWEEALMEAYNDGGKDLKPYYRELKSRVLALSTSKNFAEIRKYYFSFRGSASGNTSGNDASSQGLLNMKIISEEDNAVLSRCIAELSSLVELEEKLNDSGLIPSEPFGFFLSCLGDVDYVKANQKPGVNIFKWRVAAASPFSCNFVLNASQSAATVLYQPLRFLRLDKRKALGLEDTDASGAFFLLCDTGEEDGFRSRARISASTQTFSGWAIPHSFFAAGKTIEAPIYSGKDPGKKTGDPYVEERSFWRRIQNPHGTASEEAALQEIFPLQKRSYEIWKNTLLQKENSFSFFSSSIKAAMELPGVLTEGGALSLSNSVTSVVNDSFKIQQELLTQAILGEGGCLTVTPTRDLNVFYQCPLNWLYSRIFGAWEYSLEAALLDDTSLGLLYHVILEKLFDKIKNEDLAFNSRRLDTYKGWAQEITGAAIREHPAFRGPLAVPLVSPQAAGMAKKISRLLELEAKFFDGYTVAELELPVSYKTAELLVKGVIDRVSVSPDGEPVIIDYKTTYLPDQTAVEDLGEVCLQEFQMPVYTKLYEESFAGKNQKQVKVQGAFFYSINGRRIKTVMGEKTSGRNKPPGRDEYEPFLLAAEEQIEEFAQRVIALDFVTREVRRRDCITCMYKTACRSAYFLNTVSLPEKLRVNQ